MRCLLTFRRVRCGATSNSLSSLRQSSWSSIEKAGAKPQGFDLAANNSQAEVVKGGDGEAFAFALASRLATRAFISGRLCW